MKNLIPILSFDNRVIAKRFLNFISQKIQLDFFSGNYLVSMNTETGKKDYFVILLHSAN